MSNRDQRYVHVERASLARAALAEVINREAVLVRCNALPRLDVEQGCVRLMVGGVERKFTAAIDATGRFAGWSRPVKRHGKEIANVFGAASTGRMLRGRIVQVGEGWAYRLGLPDSITVGVVTPHGCSQGQINDVIAARLCLPDTQLRLLGRRPAFPQWAESPAKDRRLAVGDAAIAHNPIAGQGIRFALSSALAAAAVVRTWRDSPGDEEYATQFYREMVDAQRLRHLSFVTSLYADEPTPTSSEPPELSPLPPMVRYSGQTRMTGLHINGLIKCSEAIALPEGGAARWLGSFDLLTLRDLCLVPLPTATLLTRLGPERLSQAEALALIRWCLDRNILSPYEP